MKHLFLKLAASLCRIGSPSVRERGDIAEVRLVRFDSLFVLTEPLSGMVVIAAGTVAHPGTAYKVQMPGIDKSASFEFLLLHGICTHGAAFLVNETPACLPGVTSFFLAVPRHVVSNEDTVRSTLDVISLSKEHVTSDPNFNHLRAAFDRLAAYVAKAEYTNLEV